MRTLNYEQLTQKNNISLIRVTKTVKDGFEIFLVVAFDDNGKVDTRSFFSQGQAIKTATQLAPKLAQFIKVEEV